MYLEVTAFISVCLPGCLKRGKDNGGVFSQKRQGDFFQDKDSWGRKRKAKDFKTSSSLKRDFFEYKSPFFGKIISYRRKSC